MHGSRRLRRWPLTRAGIWSVRNARRPRWWSGGRGVPRRRERQVSGGRTGPAGGGGGPGRPRSTPRSRRLGPGHQHPAVVRPDGHRLVADLLGPLDVFLAAAACAGRRVRPDAVGGVDIHAVLRETPRRALPVHRQLEQRRGQHVTGDQQVPVRGMASNGTASGWYAHACSSSGRGSTGFANPKNVDSRTLTPPPRNAWVLNTRNLSIGTLARAKHVMAEGVGDHNPVLVSSFELRGGRSGQSCAVSGGGGPGSGILFRIMVLNQA